MSTAVSPTVAEPLPARRRRVLTDPAGRTTAAAGVLLLTGLGLAIGDGGGAATQVAVTGAGAIVALFVLGPSAARALKRHPGILIVLALPPALWLLAILVASMPGGETLVSSLVDLVSLALWLAPPAIALVAAIGGVVLVSDYLRQRLGLTSRSRTPWQRLTGATANGAGVARPRAWHAVAGFALLGLAAVLGFFLTLIYFGNIDVLGLLLLLGVVGAAMATPLVIAVLARRDRGQVTAAREDERQRLAAHLHDSVLQTLALVQRQAHDPAAVTRLARRQEHELRAWMAGESELGSESLSASLREAVAEVELDHGAVVEATILGDRPLDRPARALAAAAREALRNAARHAPGSPIYLFAQAGRDGVEVFVRDEGGGFAPESVPTERRGVRDAIVGRMAADGGRATIESVPGEGTEVILRIGALQERT